jgi:hypothetical protein
MYFDKFMDGSYAADQNVSHVDILVMACEGAEFCGDAEVALIEEDGRLCMTVGAEGIGDAMAAVADRAKEVGTQIWKWLVEFVRKVRAFVSQAIVSLRSGAIVTTLKRIVAKAKAKSKNDDWKENAPNPKRVTQYNIDLARALQNIYFVSEEAVTALKMSSGKVFDKLNAAIGKSDAINGGDDKNWTNGHDSDGGVVDNIITEMGKVASTPDNGGYKNFVPKAENKMTGTNPSSHNSKWLFRIDRGATKPVAEKLKVSSSANNDQIIDDVLDCANRLINSMRDDPILKLYDSIQLLDKEVGLVKKLAADAGKEGSKELKKIKKIQKAVSKVGTTCTLFCRRQLGSYKKVAALIMRKFSLAGSMEKDDYNED